MKHRLVTRSDFDGLVCAVLLRQLDLIDDIAFVHPKDVQDGVVAITGRDILTNLPYAPGAHLVFDHHHRETLRVEGIAANHVIVPDAPSAARVVYDHFGGARTFPTVGDELMAAVDQADSAAYSVDDILEPEGWTLLNFLMDSRTGLGRFRDFRISNYDLMMSLIDACIRHDSVEEILELPDVAERVRLYQRPERALRGAAAPRPRIERDAGGRRPARGGGHLRRQPVHGLRAVPGGHRLGPRDLGQRAPNTVLAVGRSIIDRSSTADIGEVMLRYGGGGHARPAPARCRTPRPRACWPR